MQNFKDWMMFYVNSNSNWGDVANAVESNQDMFLSNDKRDVQAAIEKLGLGEEFKTVWNGYMRYQTKMYKQRSKVNKTISLPEKMIKDIERYKKENKLSSFSHAAHIFLEIGMKDYEK